MHDLRWSLAFIDDDLPCMTFEFGVLLIEISSELNMSAGHWPENNASQLGDLPNYNSIGLK